MKKKIDFSGTVSHGTMRPQDVLPVFLGILEEYWPDKANKIIEFYSYDWEWPSADKSLVFSDPLPDYLQDAAMYLWEELADALNEIAPEGHYFGAHIGDGCDYGFWLVDDLC